nr:protein eceriferum 1-like [Tanacetum cinerariifolium]
GLKRSPLWRLDGVIIILLLHAGAVEFLYYWLHRALHHHFLYNRYHSHHHSSIVTEPITSVIHPFAEHIAYYALFAIPLLTTAFTGTVSILGATLSSTNANTTNIQKGTGVIPKATCYECRNRGHYRRDCPKQKNQNHENQIKSTKAHGVVHAFGGGETEQDCNNIEDEIEA